MLFALHRDPLVIFLVAILLVIAGTPPTTASSAPSSPVMFADDVISERQGEVVEIGVLFSDAEVATVRIGSEEDHVATVVVRDDDGDGRATLRLNTYGGTVATSEGDASTVNERSSVETPLAPGSYDLDLWAGNGTDGERWAVGILAVQERSTEDLRTWVAPASADVSDLSTLRAAKASGNLTRADTVAKNDTLVLELRASGLEGVLAAQNESNATAAFFSLLDGETAELQARQINPGPQVRPGELHLAEYRSTHVVADAANRSYYLVVDISRANVTGGYGDGEPAGGDEYLANFTLTNESTLTQNESESVETNFTVRPREAEVVTEYGSDEVHVASAPNRTIRARTTLAPGSNVTVVVDGPDDQFPFEATGRVRKASDGFVFAPTFDFSDVPRGTEFTVTVRHRGESIMDYDGPGDGVVTEPTASVEWGTVSEQDAGVTANLSHGGFVVVRRNSVDGEILGNSPYLDPGAAETVLVPFDPDLDSNLTLVAVAFHDRDGDGTFDSETDEPYTKGKYDHRVATSKEVSFEETDETTGRQTTESPIREGTTTDVVTEPASPAEPAIPGVGSPGFGVGPALVALAGGVLVAAALLVRRW